MRTVAFTAQLTSLKYSFSIFSIVVFFMYWRTVRIVKISNNGSVDKELLKR